MWSKLNAWLHLWLGLLSGLVVLIVSLTGCVLVFESELRHWVAPYHQIVPRTAAELVPPSAVFHTVKMQYPGKEIQSVWYYGLDKPAKVSLEGMDSVLYMHPYTAEVLAKVDEEDFFHWITAGHCYLWLKPDIGRQVVGWATFIFLILIVSGIILWWPKKWNGRYLRQAFAIKWRAKFKRINYDLHNVLGFYSMTLALLMCLTGLIMSFPWIYRSIARLADNSSQPAVEQVANVPPDANALALPQDEPLQIADLLWYKVRTSIARYNKEAIIISYPEEEGPVYVCTDMYNGTWRDLYFDRSTLKLLPRSQRSLQQANLAEWITRSNYALHTGNIGGLITKMLYFLASLICASLPVTGFYIWWGKRKGKKKNLLARSFN